MKITFDTQIVNVSDAPNEPKLYSDGDYKQAMSRLVEVLDKEPNNWQARLVLSRVIDSLNLRIESPR